MNNKISYLLNTVRCVHRYSSVLTPKSSATTRKHILWIGRYEDPLGNVNFRKLLLNILPSLHGSSLRFVSQKADVYSTGAEALVSETASQSSLEVEKLDDSGSFKAKHVVYCSDPFFSSLQKCACPCDALDLAAEAAVSMKHYTNSLTTTWRLFKNLSEEQQRYEKQLIFEHPAFAKLCQQLLRHARRMMRGDLVFSLHALVSLGVPQNTLLVQTLVRVCQVSENLSPEFGLNYQCVILGIYAISGRVGLYSLFSLMIHGNSSHNSSVCASNFLNFWNHCMVSDLKERRNLKNHYHFQIN